MCQLDEQSKRQQVNASDAKYVDTRFISEDDDDGEGEVSGDD